ncbi:hypothetical protein EIN_150940 [Entamoeba invadens IP1]|uniref:Uncharacterized protein n=1 Tax=Entamoeba invadens IP1 TaxID=370355 RepID=A0A0A1U8P5_ENTIV|nr:hypothetical protein EIN_150940 [Entamoeba invadens IP1]ELP91217.1 hypothetical protein EIN_150940 [Entamoeba invadens IP1]|eukprot:XP_004257988.1 hypothetical protein EIN_150940 [Entamoeba invadens IP1]
MESEDYFKQLRAEVTEPFSEAKLKPTPETKKEADADSEKFAKLLDRIEMKFFTQKDIPPDFNGFFFTLVYNAIRALSDSILRDQNFRNECIERLFNFLNRTYQPDFLVNVLILANNLFEKGQERVELIAVNLIDEFLMKNVEEFKKILKTEQKADAFLSNLNQLIMGKLWQYVSPDFNQKIVNQQFFYEYVSRPCKADVLTEIAKLLLNFTDERNDLLRGNVFADLLYNTMLALDDPLPVQTMTNLRIRIQLYKAFYKFAAVYIRAYKMSPDKAKEVKRMHEKFLLLMNDSFIYPRELLFDNMNTQIDVNVLLESAKDILKNIDCQPNSRLIVVFNRALEIVAKVNMQSLTTLKIISMYKTSWEIAPSHRLGIHNLIHPMRFIKQVFDNICQNKNVLMEVKKQSELTLRCYRLATQHLTTIIQLITILPNPMESIKHFFWNTTSRNTPRIIENVFEFLKLMVDLLPTVVETFQQPASGNEEEMEKLLFDFFKQCIHNTIMVVSCDDKQCLSFGINNSPTPEPMKKILMRIQANNRPENDKQIDVIKKSVRYLMKRVIELPTNNALKVLSLYDEFLVFLDKYVMEVTFSTFLEMMENTDKIEDVAIMFKRICMKIKSFIDPVISNQVALGSSFDIADYQQTLTLIVGKCFKQMVKYLTEDDEIDVEPYVNILEGCYLLYPLEVVSCLGEKTVEVFSKIYLNNPFSEIPFYYLSKYISSLSDPNEIYNLPNPLLRIAEMCIKLPLHMNKLLSFLYISLPIASTVICCKKVSESFRSTAHRYLNIVCSICPPAVLYKFIPSVDNLKKALAEMIGSNTVMDFPKHDNIQTKPPSMYIEEPFKTSLISALASLAVLPHDTTPKIQKPVLYNLELKGSPITFDLFPFCEEYLAMIKKQPENVKNMIAGLKSMIKHQPHPALFTLYFATLNVKIIDEKMDEIDIYDIRISMKREMKMMFEGFVNFLEDVETLEDEKGFTAVCDDVLNLVSETGGLEPNREGLVYFVSLIGKHEQGLSFDLHAVEFILKYSLKYTDWLSVESHIVVRYLFDVTQRMYHNRTINRILDSLLSPTSLDSIIQTIDDSLPRWLHDLFVSVITSDSPEGVPYIIEFFKRNSQHPEISLLLSFDIDPTNYNFNDIFGYQLSILEFMVDKFKTHQAFKSKVDTILKIKIPRQYIIRLETLMLKCCDQQRFTQFVRECTQSKDVNISSHFCAVLEKLFETNPTMVEEELNKIDLLNIGRYRHTNLFSFILRKGKGQLKDKVQQIVSESIEQVSTDIVNKVPVHKFVSQLDDFFVHKYNAEGICGVITELKGMYEYRHILCIIQSLKRVLNLNPQQSVATIMAEQDSAPKILYLLATMPDLDIFPLVFQHLLGDPNSLWKKDNGPIALLRFFVKFSQRKQMPDDMNNAIINLSYNTTKPSDEVVIDYTKILLNISRYQMNNPELLRQILVTLETSEQEKFQFVMLHFIKNFPTDVKNVFLTMRAINEAVEGRWRLLVYAMQFIVVPLIRTHTKEFNGNVMDELRKMLMVVPNTPNVTIFDEVQGTQLHVFIEAVSISQEFLEPLRSVILENNSSPTSLHNACLKLHAQLLVYKPGCGLFLDKLLEELLELPINEIYFNSISIGNIEIETIQHFFESNSEEQQNICKIILRHINSTYQENVLPFTFPVKYFYVFYQQRRLFVPTILRSIEHFEERREMIKCIDLSELIMNWERFRVNEKMHPLSDTPVLVSIMEKCANQEHDNDSLFQPCYKVVVNNFKIQAQNMLGSKPKTLVNQTKHNMKRLTDCIDSILTIWGSEAKKPLMSYNELTEYDPSVDKSLIKEFLIACARADPPILYEEGKKFLYEATQEHEEEYVPLVKGYLVDPRFDNEMNNLLTNRFIPYDCFACVKEFVERKKIKATAVVGKVSEKYVAYLKQITGNDASMCQTPLCERLKSILEILIGIDTDEARRQIMVLGRELFDKLAESKTQLSGEEKLVTQYMDVLSKCGKREEMVLKAMSKYFTNAERNVVETQRIDFLEMMIAEDDMVLSVRSVGMENPSTATRYVEKFVKRLKGTDLMSLFVEIVNNKIPNEYHTEKWVGVFVSVLLKKLEPDNFLGDIVLTNLKLAERLFVAIVMNVSSNQEIVKTLKLIYNKRRDKNEVIMLEVMCENNVSVGDLCLYDSDAMKFYGKGIKFLTENFVKYQKPELVSQLYTFLVNNPVEKYKLLAPMMKNQRLKYCMEQFPTHAESLHNITKDLLTEMQANNDEEYRYAAELKIDLALMLNLYRPLMKYGEAAIKMAQTEEEKRRINDLMSTCLFNLPEEGEKEYTNGNPCLQCVYQMCQKLTMERADRTNFNSEFSQLLVRLVEVLETNIRNCDLDNQFMVEDICTMAVILKELIETQFFMLFYNANANLNQTLDKTATYSILFCRDLNTKELYVVRQYALTHHKKTFEYLSNKKTSSAAYNALIQKFEKLEILNQIEFARYHRRMHLFSPAITILEDVNKKLEKKQGGEKQGLEKQNEEINNLFIRVLLEMALNADALERPLQMVKIMQTTYDNYIHPVIESNANTKNNEEINMFFQIMKVLHYPTID